MSLAYFTVNNLFKIITLFIPLLINRLNTLVNSKSLDLSLKTTLLSQLEGY